MQTFRRVTPWCVFASLFATAAQADQQETINELGQSLVSAIKEDDAVAYAQCWMSDRQAITYSRQHNIGLSEQNLQELKVYNRKRNQTITRSFKQIQKFLAEQKIDRTSLKFHSCEAYGLRTKTTPNGKSEILRAGGFRIFISVGEKKWRMRIDDGVELNGLWYFSDRPLELTAGETRLSFADDRVKP